MLILDLPLEADTEKAANALAGILFTPLVLGFSGEIGAGKTTFIRAMLRALGIQGAIKSPTYALVESYHINTLNIHHFDLYRIQNETELDYIGFRDYFMTPAICCIEWCERLEKDGHCMDIHLSFAVKDLGRVLQIESKSTKGSFLLPLLLKVLSTASEQKDVIKTQGTGIDNA